MRRCISKISVWLLVVSLLFPTFTTKIYAINTDCTRKKLRNAVLISNNINERIEAIGEGLKASSNDDIDEENLGASSVIISNYEEIVDDEKLLTSLSKRIYEGSVVYLRVENSKIGPSEVNELFDFSHVSGRVIFPEEYASNKKTCGYIIYFDGQGVLQVVSSEIGVIQADDFIGAPEAQFSNTLTDDLDALNNFLELNTADHKAILSSNYTRSNGTSFVTPINTIVWRAAVKNSSGNTVYVNIGQTTMTLFADRLAINRDTSTWSDTSVWVTQWAYRAQIYIQPIWNQSSNYRSLNKSLRMYYTTHPNNSSGGTYGMHLLSLQPESSFSGQTNVEMSFGVDASVSGSGISGAVSVVTSYPDIRIIIRDFSRNNDTHHARTDFVIGTPSAPKTVNVASVGIVSGVVAANYRTIPMSMQIGYSARWFVTQGSKTDGVDVYNSDYIIWQPGESW